MPTGAWASPGPSGAHDDGLVGPPLSWTRHVVALARCIAGTVAAHLSGDVFDTPTSSREPRTAGWHTASRAARSNAVRYDGETGRSWLCVRAYDPTCWRFLARDPLGRMPLVWANQPYGYAANNPLRNVDPSGQRVIADDESGPLLATPPPAHTGALADVQTTPGTAPGQSSDPCDAACYDRELLAQYWEHVRILNHMGGDGVVFFADLAAAAVDGLSAVGGDEFAWVSVATDLVALLASGVTLFRDYKAAHGSSLADMRWWSGFSAVVQGMAVAANAAAAMGWFAFLFSGIGGLVKGGMKELLTVLKPQIYGLIMSVLVTGGAWVTMSDAAIDAQKGALPGTGVSQLRQQCLSYGLHCK